jgi:exopolyphosphatase/guanosine-5'-triphosphate,3'-diphosphate pyrophosphatase
MQTIAAIDAGSNAIRMVVGRINDIEQVESIDNIRLPVRLGSDAFSQGQIGERTMQAAVDAFLRFRKVADDFAVTRIRAIATSAMREASNSDLLIDRIARQTGISLEVISGDEEARLVHLAVGRAINLKAKRSVLVDIGGGSVEVTLSEGENILSSESYNMGTVRLLRKFSAAETQRLSLGRLVQEYAEAARRRIDREIGRKKVDLCIGTGGNIEEMGELRRKLFKRDSNRLIAISEMEDLIEKLNGMTVQERIKKLGLRPDRADVILPAAVVIHTIAQIARVKEVQIPGVGLKDGILWDMASQVLPRLPRREQVWASAMRLGRKFQLDSEHGSLVAELAGQLFKQSVNLHGLDEDSRLALEVAALLHDIGHFINTIDHDKHGYYILKNNFIFGLTERQQTIVANIVRYHRKTVPSVEDENFKALPQKDRIVVTKLSALLRLADGIDTSHTGRIDSVRLAREKNNKWALSLNSAEELALEKWALTKRRALFQDVFGVELEIE